MKQTVLKFGSYGLVASVVLFSLALAFGDGMSYSAQEVLGYLTILASLSFIYFGIKHYRDKINNGVVGLGKAIGIGILIAILVGVGIAIADYIYTTQINPDFMTEYMEYTLKTLEENLSPEEFAIEKVKVEEQMQAMGSSTALAFVMFATVVIIGFLVSLLSGLILQRKN